MSVCNGLRRSLLSILNYVSHFFLKVSEVHLLLLGPSPMIVTHKFNPAQLDSVQKLINNSITTMSDNLMAKFSSMLININLGNIIFLVHLPLRCRGNQPPVLSQRPVSQLTESRALRVVDFGRATRIRYRMRILVFAIGSWTRLLRLLGILQGIPESLRICAELQPSSGITRLELVFIRNLTLATA